MFAADHQAFHVARAAAERVAADKSACEMTRNLHLELAALHVGQAQFSLLYGHADKQTVWHRQGAKVRFNLGDG